MNFQRPLRPETPALIHRPLRPAQMEIDLRRVNEDPSQQLAVSTHKTRAGFFQQITSLAQSLLPGQTVKATITTIEFSAEALPQETPTHPIEVATTSLAPVGPQTARRLFFNSYRSGQFNGYDWQTCGYSTRSDGTTILSILHNNGFRYEWMISPETLKPIRLHWVNE